MSEQTGNVLIGQISIVVLISPLPSGSHLERKGRADVG